MSERPEQPLPARHRRLLELTSVPTVPGREERVVRWVEEWAGSRPELQLRPDRFGNLLLTVDRASPRPPLVAVAHMDHPGFVVDRVEGLDLEATFRGGGLPPTFAGAPVEVVDGRGQAHPGEVEGPLSEGSVRLRLLRPAPVSERDIARWRFEPSSLGIEDGMLRAHACDDLAGVAAVLEALDVTRRRPELAHFAALLTRGEEVGLVGAIGAARSGTLPNGSRVISVETSRSFPDSPAGGGAIVRVGDASTIFDPELTGALVAVAREAGVTHRRKLMSGGTCEATAFAAYGIPATGACLALENYHNITAMAGAAESWLPRPEPERISLSDFDGLVALLVAAAERLDDPDRTALRDNLDDLFQREVGLLSG